MDYPKFGVYQAVVTDNSEFYKKGYIRIRPSVFYNGDINWDLSKNYSEDKYADEVIKDIKCYIFTPIGGGNGHGLFSLPQVNSVGVISFIDGNIDKALWLGSFINPQFDEDGKFKSANVPNDTLTKEGAGQDGLTSDGKNNETEGGAVIFRQKSTVAGSADGLIWDKNRTENLVVFSKDELKITHVTEWDEAENKLGGKPIVYHEILFSKEEKASHSSNETEEVGKIEVKSYKVDDENKLNEIGLEIIDNKVTLKASNSKSKITNEVTVEDEKMSIDSSNLNTKDETHIRIDPKLIQLDGGDTTINIKKNEININGNKKITLSGDEINLGGLGQYVVVAAQKFSYRMEDGTTLSSSPVAIA